MERLAYHLDMTTAVAWDVKQKPNKQTNIILSIYYPSLDASLFSLESEKKDVLFGVKSP